MEDEKIVEMYLCRDETAIRHTSEKYGNQLRSISYRITADQFTSEECENDTYMEAWKRIPPNEPRTYLFPFLSRIIRNISINKCIERERLKRRAYVMEFTKEMEQCIPAPDDVDSHFDSAVLGDIISRFLHMQKKEKRIIFMHRYYYLDSVSAIAMRFGYTESKVKTTLFRMRNDLREYLIKEDYTL